MSANVALILAASAMIGCGIYLLLERSLTRVLVGLVMMSNGVNVLFLVASGPAGRAPIVGRNDPSEMSDPLPQALVLTAIVISLATSAFVLAMAYRSWQLTGHDDVQDDVEDRTIRRLAETDQASDSFDLSSGAAEEDFELPEEEGSRG
ncbi:Na(+)/H(+) antiporter subunit C [Nocardioides sp. TF02-7]|uniref:Na(+)/H(+) antiporter subunit C n=1 Tax=Nocardioides sp. TF02-7 TaxID=2917724 RepID=UPI001F052765|nr:Na(+)/H(+) antiporter subunit C [Nocardioides sp. TF02-7]UMG92761.1 Na(+)/H(+) antiporter subunit C [Nocardioides sp. TF02-7]